MKSKQIIIRIQKTSKNNLLYDHPLLALILSDWTTLSLSAEFFSFRGSQPVTK